MPFPLSLLTCFELPNELVYTKLVILSVTTVGTGQSNYKEASNQPTKYRIETLGNLSKRR